MSTDYQISAQGHRGTRAIQRLVEYAPASGGLALWMQHRNVDTAPARAYWAHSAGFKKRWMIGNDGTTLFYGAAFEEKSLSEQTGLVAHQVLHVALRHVARERDLADKIGDLDAELFALCADAIVNSSLSHLEWLSLPSGSVFLDTVLLRLLGIEESVEVSLHRWDTEALYRAIDDRDNAGSTSTESGRQSQDNSSASQSTLTSHIEKLNRDGPKTVAARQLAATLNRDLVPDENMSPEQTAEQQQQWSERLSRAHTADSGQSLMRQLLGDNKPARTPWQQILRTRLQRSLAQKTDINWSRPNRSWIANQGRTSSGRRMPWQPGLSHARQCPRLCILVDVSGSVENSLMQRFANEIDRMMRIHRADVFLIVGDDTVRQQVRLKAGCKPLRDIEFSGGGGTRFAPLLDAASELKPDIGVFLTDLDGPAGEPRSWPVIWAVPEEASARPVPFGQMLVLD